MMVTLLGSLLGFIGSLFPEIIKIFRDKQDKKHELKLMQLQIEREKTMAAQRLEEVQLLADVAESAALYKTYNTGICWVDALNGTVRPVLAYAFFAIYAVIKIMAIRQFPEAQNLTFSEVYQTLWTGEDSAIFAGIVSFYFGSRSFQRARNKK